jgi:thioredoxin 1
MQTELCREFTNASFEKEVLQNEGVVLVDFWATWCGPCRMVSPIIDELAREYDGKIVVGKINVDEEPELSEKYRVMTIPTVIVFKAGTAMSRKSGAFAKSEYIDMINKVL